MIKRVNNHGSSVSRISFGSLRRRLCRIGAVSAILSSIFSAQQAKSQTTYTWNGTTSNSWGTATNWGGGSVPGGALDDIVLFNSASTANLSTSIGATNFSIGTISVVDPGAAVSIAGTGTITLNSQTAFDLSAATQNLTITANLAFAYAGSQILNVNTGRTLTLGAASMSAATTGLTFAGAGNTTFTGAMALAGAATFNNSGTGFVTLAALNGANTITKSGSGAVTLGGIVALGAGGINLNAGTLTMGGVAHTFTGPVNIDGATSIFAFTGQAGADPTFGFGAGAKNVTITNGATLRALTSSDPSATTKSFIVGTGGATFDVPSGSTFTLNDANQFSGTGNLAVTSSGTGGGVVILGQATIGYTGYTGNVTVNSGTLRLVNTNAVGNTVGQTIAVSPGATLDLQASGVPQLVTIAGTGVAASGALISAGGAPTFPSALTLAADSSIGGTSNLTIAGAISGAFNITKVGVNTLILSGTSNAASGIAVNAGTLQANNVNALGAGTVTLGGGNLTFALDGNGTGQNQTLSAPANPIVLTAAATIGVNRSGTAFAPNFPTPTNKTIALSGPLNVGSFPLTVLNSNGYGLEIPTGTLTIGTTPTIIVQNAVGTGPGLVQGLTISSVLSGSLAVTKQGAGALVLTNPGNTHTGNYAVSSGLLMAPLDGALGNAANAITLGLATTTSNFNTTNTSNAVTTGNTAGLAVGQVVSGTGIPAGATITAITSGTSFTLSANATATGTAVALSFFSNAGFEATGTYATNRTFTIAGSGASASNVLSVTQDNTLTITSALTGTNALTKSDPGILVLSNAANSITGGLVASGGILRIPNAGSAGAGTITVAANEGTAFQLDGSGGAITLARPFTLTGSTGIQNNGQIENFAGSNTVSGVITLAAAATIGNSAPGTALSLTGGIGGAFGLTFNGPGDVNVNTTAIGAVTGITRNGSGTTNITTANPLFVSGVTVNGATLTLSGAGTFGTGAVATTVTSGGTFFIDNSGTSQTGRLGTTRTMNLSNGTFRITGGSGAIAESMGALTGTWGNSVIRLDPGASTLAVTYASVTINGGSTLLFQSGASGSSSTFGSTNSQVFFTAAPTLVPATSGILPRSFVFDNTGGTPSYNFTSYNHNGVAVNALGIQAFTGYNVGNNLVTAANTDTMLLTAAANFATSRTLNAIAANGTFTIDSSVGLLSQTLTSGQMLVQAGNVTLSNNLIVAFGGTQGEVGVAPGATLTLNGAMSGSIQWTKSLGGTLQVNSRQYFNTGTSFAQINGGTMVLNGGDNTLFPGQGTGNLASWAVGGTGVLDLNGTVQQVGDFRSQNNNAFFGNGGTVQSGSPAILSTRQANANWSGQITGPVTFAMSNTTFGNVERFYNDNTYTGRTGIMGGTLELTDLGRLSGTTAVDISYGTLNILNTSGNNGRFNLADRIPDGAPITLRGGFVLFAGRAQSASAESLGTVTLAQGVSNLNVTNGGTGVNSSVLTLADVIRSSNDAALNLQGANGQLGSASRLLITTRETTPGLTNNLVGAWAVSSGNEFLSYIPGLGLAALNAGGFPGYDGTVIPAASAPTQNIRTATTAITLPTGGITLNTLVLVPTAAQTITFGANTDVLNLTSGGLIKQAAFTTTIGAAADQGRLTVGGTSPSGTQYLFIHNGAGSATPLVINSRIVDNGASPVRLVANLYNTGNVNLGSGLNSYTGGTVVNGWASGTQTNTLNALVAGAIPAGGVTINNGILTGSVAGAINAANDITINGGGVLNLNGANTLANINFNNVGGATNPAVNTGGVLTLTGTITAGSNNTGNLPVINGSLDFGGGTRTLTINPIVYQDSTNATRTLTALQPTLNIAGVIQNAGLLSVTGGGRLQLSGQSTFGGGVNVDAASGLVVGANSTPASGTVTSGPVGTGTLTAASGATFLSTGSFTLANPFVIQGNVNFDGINNLTFTGPITLPASAFNLSVAAPQQTVSLLGSSFINPTTAINKTGYGTLILGPNYTGALTVSGNLSYLNDGDGTGQPNVAGVYNNAITASGPLNVTIGRLGTTYAPYFTTASNKILQFSNFNLAGNPLTVANNNGYGMEIQSGQGLGSNLVITVATATNSNVTPGLTFSGILSGGSGLVKQGAGTLALTNAGNTFGGAGQIIDIQAGAVAANSDGSLGDAANAININNNSAALGNGFRATGTFATGRTINLALAANAIEVTGGNTLTLNAPFTVATATNTLAKNDAGTLVLAAANPGTWTGGVTINQGALRIGAAGTVGSATAVVTVAGNAGSALQLSNVSLPNPITLAATQSGINSAGGIQAVAGTSTTTGLITQTAGFASFIGADAGATLNITGGFSGTNSINFNVGSGGAINVTTTALTITGGNNFAKFGAGTMNVQTNNAAMANLPIVNAGTLSFSGAGVAGTSANGVTINPGGTLLLDSSGAAPTANRLGGKSVTFVGGNLNLLGGTAVTNEAIGAPVFNRGQTTITVTDGGAGTNLTFGAASNNVSPAQSTGGSGATVLFRGTSLGTAAGAGVATIQSTAGGILFNGQTGATGTTSKAIMPWAIIDTTATGLGTSFATGDAAAAAANTVAILRPLASTEYSNTAALVANTNSLINTASGSLASQATTTVNSITFDNSTTLAMNPFQTLTVSSGGILVRNGSTSSIGGGIASAPAGNSGWNIHTPGTAALTISSLMTGGNSTAAMGFVKAGAGTLTLNTPVSTIGGLTNQSQNTLLMQTVVNQGTLRLNGGTNALGANNYLEIGAGGTVDLNGNSQYVLGLYTDGAVTGINGVTAGGTVANTAAAQATLVTNSDARNWAGAITGNIFYNRTGSSSTTSIYNAQTYTGGTLINGGLVQLRDYGTLGGTGSIAIQYGQLNLDNNQTAGIAGRLNTSAGITLRGGTLVFQGRAQTDSTDTVGGVSVVDGWNNLTVLAGGTNINSAVLTASSLGRIANATGIVNFSQANGGAAANGQIGSAPRLLFTTAPTLTNNIIGPWAINSREWASYIPGLGEGQLNATGFPGYAAANLTTGAATDNIRLTAAATLTANSTVNTLNVNTAATTTIDLGTFRLTLAGGGLMNATSNTSNVTFQNGTLTSGFANGAVNDLYFYHLPYAGASRFGIISAAVVNNGATPVRLIVSSSETAGASLTSTAGPVTTNFSILSGANTYTGGTVFNGGNSVVANGGTLPAGGVTLNGATLGLTFPNAIITSAGTINAANVVTLNGPSTLALVNNTTLGGLVFNNIGATAIGANSSTNQTPTVSTFQAGLGTAGTGTLTLTGSAPQINATSSNVQTTSIVVGRLDTGAGLTINTDPILVNGINVAPLQATMALQGISGTGAITKTGLGILQQNAQATYSGATTVNAGGISFGSLGNTGLAANNAAGSRFSSYNLTTPNTFLTLNNTDATIGSLAGSGTVFNATVGLATGRTFNVGFDGTSTTFSGSFARFSDALLASYQVNKIGGGTMSLTGASTTTSNLQISQGGVTYGGAAGSAAFGTTIVLPTATLTLDNSGANLNNRLGGNTILGSTTATTLQVAGGNFTVIGNATNATTESVGSFNLGAGNAFGPSVVTLQANAAQPLTFTVATTWGGIVQGTGLLRGLSATAGNGLANFNLGAIALAGTGGGGANGTTTMSIRPDMLGDASASGLGTGFIVKDSATNFLRPLAAGELAPATLFISGGGTATNNFGFSTTVNSFASTTVNSLTLSGGGGIAQLATLLPAGVSESLPIAQTVTSGGILTLAGNSTITANRLGTASNLFFQSLGNTTVNGVLTGTTLTKAGSGSLTLNSRSFINGITHVNQGTLTLNGGDNTLFAALTAGLPTVQALGLNSPTAVVDLNGNSQLVGSLFATNSTQRYSGSSGTITNSSATTATLTTILGANHVFGGVIAGNLSFNKTANFSYTLTNANTYSGATNVRANTLQLIDNGSIASTAINLNFAGLNIDNSGLTPLANLNPQRIPAAATVSLRGGTLTLTSGGTSDTTQTVNTVNALLGHNTISVPQAPISGFGALTIGNLVLNADATINLTGGAGGFLNNNPGLNQSQLFITQLNGTAIPTTITNKILGGNLIANNGEFVTVVQSGTTGSNGINWGVITMNGITGPLGTLTQNQYDSNAATFPASSATSNVRLTTAGTVTLPTGATTLYNSLALRVTGITVGFNTATDTLNIASGGLALTGGTAVIGASAGSGVLTAGGAGATGTQRLYIHSTGSTINSVIADNSGTAPLRLVANSISGTLALAGVNTYTGGTVINGGGTVNLTNTTAGSLPGGGITINGSTLTATAAVNQIATTNDVTLNGSSTLTLGNFANTLNSLTFNNTGGTANPTVAVGTSSLTLAGSNAITAFNDNAATVPTISGTQLNLPANANITTSTTANVPTNMVISAPIAAGSINKLGTGSLLLNGGSTPLTAGSGGLAGTTLTVTSSAGILVGQGITGVGIPLGTTVTAVPNATTVTLSNAAFATTTTALAGTTFTTGATTITATSTAGLFPGMVISGTGITAGTTISSITNATTFVISAVTTAASAGNYATAVTPTYGGSPFAGGLNLTSGSLILGSSAVNGVGPIGTGTLTISGGTAIVSDTAIRTVNNPVTVNGDFTFGSTAGISNAQTVAVNGAVLAGNVNLGSATRSINVNSYLNSSTLSGVVSNGTAGVGLTKTGPGILVLSPSRQLLLNLANASTTVTTTDTTGLTVGQPVSGTGIPAGATVASITDLTTFVISAAATSTGTLTVSTGTFGLANTFDGPVNINGGTLSATYAGSLGTAGTITFGGGILQHGGTNVQDYSSRFASTAGQPFFIDTLANVVTYATALTSSGPVSSLGKFGSGTLILTANPSFGGVTVINAGTLQLGDNSGAIITLPATTTVMNSGFLAVSSALDVSFTGIPIVGTGGFIQAGSGTTTLAGAVAQYTGLTAIDRGVLRFDANTTLAGGLAFGSTTGITTNGTLDLTTTSLAVSSMLVQNNNATGGNLNIGAGQSLTVNGNFTMGNTVTQTRSKLTVAGAGGFVVNNVGGTFRVGVGPTGTNVASGSNLDMSGLATFTANLGTAGLFSVGVVSDNQGSVGGNPFRNDFYLPTTSSITAGTLSVGASASGNVAGGTLPNGGVNTNSLLAFGTGTATINATTINIGTGSRDSGRISFGAGAGSVVIRDAAGTGPATLNIGTGGATTGNTGDNLFDLTGRTVDAQFGVVSMGTQTRNGAYSNTFTADRGTITIASLNAASRSGAAPTASMSVTSNINLGSASSTLADTFSLTNGITSLAAANPAAASFNVTANGTVTIAGGTVGIGATAGVAINMATATAANATFANTANGIINFNGGVANIGGTIVKATNTSGTTLVTSATVNINGGTVNMGGFSVGTSTNLISFNAQAGTINQLGQLNGGGAAGTLTKTTAGVLNMTGISTYTGPTVVTAGVLAVNGTIGSGAGTNVIVNGGTLQGLGTILHGAGNSVTVNTGGAIKGGNSPGTLTIGDSTNVGVVNMNAGANFVVDLRATGAAFSATGTLTGNTGGSSPAAGSDNSRVALAGTGSTLNFNSWTGSINILGNASLFDGTTTNTYSFLVGSASSAPGFTNIIENSSALSRFNISNFVGASAVQQGGTFALVQNNGNIYFEIAPVPEPAEMLLIGSAMAGLVGWVRRRRNKV